MHCDSRRPTILELPIVDIAADRGAALIERAFESLPPALQTPADPHAFDGRTLELLRRAVPG
jgi:hypothetical protein